MRLFGWECDACREPIKSPKRALVAWNLNEDNKAYGFAIVHKPELGALCQPRFEKLDAQAVEMERFVGGAGQSALLSFLSHGPLAGGADSVPLVKDFDGYVDLFRRLQTPGYEQARRRFFDDDVQRCLGHLKDHYPYIPSVLKRINERTL